MLESVAGLGGPSGTYSVRASEVARHKALGCIRVQVQFLDDSLQVFEIEKRAKGQVLLDLVHGHQELSEKDFFGLQYTDPLHSSDQPWRWLDPLKVVKKQLQLHTKSIGSCGLPILYFRVKFWVSDPGKLAEEYTRYQFVLQLRKDIIERRLPAPPSTAVLLASYALQAELGDFSPSEHGSNYITHLRLVPDQTPDVEKKIMELHKLHKGQMPADAEFSYLDHAKRLDLYGIDLHKAKDSASRELFIGVTSLGLVVLQNGIRINTFSWGKIIKVSFKRKQFFIQLRREVLGDMKETSNSPTFLQILKRSLSNKTESYDSALGFNLPSYRACKCLWKSCVEHHTFFRLHAPRPPNKRSVLTLGSKFRYSGRTEYQTVEDCKRRPVLERKFVRSPSKQFLKQPSLKSDELLSVVASRRRGSVTGPPLRSRTESSGYKVTSLLGAKTPKMAWGEIELISGEANGTVIEDGQPPEILQGISAAPSPEAVSMPAVCASSVSSSSAGSPVTLAEGGVSVPSESQPGGTDESAHGLVTIRMKPDETGKFGFNVKGGADQQQAVLVSRVAPGTPADRCYPRLNEGDQVLLINGRDVSAMSHDQVVNFIRASRESHSGELVLTVKQNVYEPENIEEPAFQYVPESLTGTVSTVTANGRVGALDESMLLLSEGLESGSLIAQFEQLYRRKPGLTMSSARLPENEKKNRYRDISPYDSTRIVLLTAPSGEYINASFVNMEIPGSGIVNRYIASQGPLSTTCADFWYMIWEQQCTLVVMLTTVVEQGRVKCHRYWPRLYEAAEFGSLQITCHKEEETPGFAFREFVLLNNQTEEERHITHMQYLAWPDHGVPSDSTEFLNFVKRVRRERQGMVEPTVVHCSAGIGRTGVLILMETAQCLIEANEPVYPLDTVRIMRDQRAMMIQTSMQYRFVCEAIQRVYTEGMVKPLEEYQQR